MTKGNSFWRIIDNDIIIYMNNLLTSLVLAEAGFLFHVLKQYYENNLPIKGKDTNRAVAWIAMNQIAIFLLIYLLPTLPKDVFVMSPLTAVIIGGFANSILSGLMNAKRPNFNNGPEQFGTSGPGGGTNPPPNDRPSKP